MGILVYWGGLRPWITLRFAVLISVMVLFTFRLEISCKLLYALEIVMIVLENSLNLKFVKYTIH